MEIKNKKILVTGGTGFIGSHLVENLVHQGIVPVVICRTQNPRSYYFTQNLQQKSVLVFTDINNFSDILSILLKYEIRIIYHLAAQALVESAYLDPLTTLKTNILGTANILEAARHYGKTEAIVVASSDKAYGKKGQTKYRETDSLKGDHPYEVSKSSSDLICQMYIKTYRVPISITRFGNVFGEGDFNFSRIIPGIMKALINKEVLDIRSNGKFVRDYVYVKDVVDGYLSLIKHWPKTSGEAFNFGSQENFSVFDLIKQIEETLQVKVKIRILNQTQNEVPYQSLNYSKVKRLTGWGPKFSLDKTLSSIFKWYKNYFVPLE